MTDIAVTWPKTRPLGSYYAELERARRHGQLINFRVPARPRELPQRCYMVYDGAVRCWSPVKALMWRGEGEVRRVDGMGFWPEGWYIVREPFYAEIEPIPMKGFQGFRYFDRSIAKDRGT
jgi:hypothetical protein